MALGLYIHIPFCRSRCPYCDFAFVVRKTHLAQRYIRAVVAEVHTRCARLETPVFDTVYFGGGTPSAIAPEMLAAVCNAVEMAPDAEITVEANPGDQAHFRALRELGVNRLSLGVQAFSDRALKALGRFHTAADAVEALETARKIGFANIGIDLIFGAPEQTLSEWHAVLDAALARRPEHLSVYGLTVEPGTNFGRRFAKGRLPLPPEAEQADMYLAAVDRLERAGYEHYEISNFARPGFASRHNQSYWQGVPYLGVGLSAHAYLNGRRSWNVRDLTAYMEAVETTGTAVEAEETLDENARFLERIMLGMRQRRGLDAPALESDPRTRPQLQRLFERRLIERAGGRIRLTRTGLLLADAVCAELVKNV